MYNSLPGKALDYDFSLLRLRGTFNFSSSLQPARLPHQWEFVNSGIKAIISGWGSLKEGNNRLPRELRSATIKVVSHATCAKKYGKIFTDRMLCAGFIANGVEGGIDTCQGEVIVRVVKIQLIRSRVESFFYFS